MHPTRLFGRQCHSALVARARVRFYRAVDETGERRAIPFLKAYTVFNVAQCDNLPAKVTDPASDRRAINPHARDALAEAFMSSTGADIRHGEARAYYAPLGDYVNLPAFETFKSASRYYGVAFHELGHWTGADKRLGRTFGKRFGDRAYAVEELVAELTSAFLCGEFGFDNDGADADYIATWIKLLEEHEKVIVSAAAAASRAVEFMREAALAAPVLEDELEPMLEAA
jgi:antirestriction protein ArdC